MSGRNRIVCNFKQIYIQICNMKSTCYAILLFTGYLRHYDNRIFHICKRFFFFINHSCLIYTNSKKNDGGIDSANDYIVLLTNTISSYFLQLNLFDNAIIQEFRSVSTAKKHFPNSQRPNSMKKFLDNFFRKRPIV